MADTQMLSKYLPKKLYNAAADEDGTDLTAKEALPEDRLDTIEALLGKKAAQTGSTISEDVNDLVTLVGDYSAPKDKDIATDLATLWDDVYPKSEPDGTSISERMDALDDTETGLLARAAALEAVAPTTGAPITAQVSATAISSKGNNDEITWTAVANGEDGNGITIDITLSAEANGIDITVDGKAIAVDVKTGEGTTATDVLTAVNAHGTAGLLVQGALTGSGGAITADSVVTDEGVDITAGLAGAIRYEADKIWISVGESTASVSNWKYAALS